MAQSKLFGTELRRLRVAAGLSLGDLADVVHYSKGYLSKIESGDKPPNTALARRCGPFPVRWTRREGRPVPRETQEWVRHAGHIPRSTRPTR
jgi:transcriptional regulator with XRE-family HTH domain